MRFLGRNSNQSEADAPTAAKASPPSDEGGGRFGFIGRMTNNLLDANDGRYRARLASSMPERTTIAQIMLGMIIGMITAYLIIPTEFAGASPRHLNSNAVAQWVRMVAVGHSEAIRYDDANTLLVLQQIPNPQQVVDQLIDNTQIPESEREALSNLKDIEGFDELDGAVAPVDPGLIVSSLQIGLALLIVAIGISVFPFILTLIWKEFIVFDTPEDRDQRASDPEPAATQGQVAKAQETSPQQQWLEEETERSGHIDTQFGLPILHTLSTYTKGRNYDDSFAIELGPEHGSEFLGECGVSVATQIGNELQSVELWCFDMTSQETLAKVFAAPAAVNDPALQATVANRVKNPATDIVSAEPGAELLLDTHTMRIQAKINTIIYNYGGGTPSSGIENLQIELLAWQKQSRRFGTPAGGLPPVPPPATASDDYVDTQFAPPSQMPSTSPAPPPPATGQTPSKPALPRRPEDEDDDPFGGTGNFMPSS